MSENVNYYTQRCSYCMKKVGKANLKRCSRCRFVQYCSRECQRAAWPTHRTGCATGGAFKDSLERPEKRLSKKLNEDFTKWLNYYRRLICSTIAVPAFNLANSPPDKLATHCLYLVVERQYEAPAVPLYFRMISGQILTRQEMVDILNTFDLRDEEVDEWARDNRGDHTVHIIIKFEDMLRFLWFSLRDLAWYRSIDPTKANELASQWTDCLAGAIETGYAGPEENDD
ncbi:hypothetical protein DAEQUDRAFT_64216 [Daedalea quercina L-15889]|uniref:MYND-type domain-containing protein n=1 Tax=Daedalea quercina L-15889 TaxID=1314783 RepID=A0A165SN03_9APHY|nr:hypothetical protein DAEQUDRAFT_64216 [Daedalea quercina L-15889]